MQLTDHGKIPRSLRIKCELTTSPDYSSHQDFLLLKEQLQDAVTEFMETGSTIMIKWASLHIQLLTLDQGSSILRKALKLLDALASFHTDVIGNLNWPSVSHKYIPLLLLKLYTHGSLGSCKELLAYLELSTDELAAAVNKLKSKMESLDSVNATTATATATAIAKAYERLQENETRHTHDSIRIATLEKNLKRQEQKQTNFQMS